MLSYLFRVQVHAACIMPFEHLVLARPPSVVQAGCFGHAAVMPGHDWSPVLVSWQDRLAVSILCYCVSAWKPGLHVDVLLTACLAAGLGVCGCQDCHSDCALCCEVQ